MALPYGGSGTIGGNSGDGRAPDIDFNRILGKLIRFFGQTKEYWLDHGTLHDWADIYGRELLRCPPADEFVADYFGYDRPGDEVEETEEYGQELPDYEA